MRATIFTIPKPFTDPLIKLVQINAITSWTKLGADFDVILMGDEPGISELAQSLKIKQIKEIKKNEFGTPLLSSAFRLAREQSQAEILIYANADIIFTDELIEVLRRLPQNDFIAAGRRWDLELKELINFNDAGWRNNLIDQIKKNGRLHPPTGIDYYIFPRQQLADLPDFAVGRVGWDNWVIFQAKKKKIRLIDLSADLTVIHQTHGYPAFNKGAARKTNPEAEKNKALARKTSRIYNLNDADYLMISGQLKKNYFRWFSFLKRYIKYRLR